MIDMIWYDMYNMIKIWMQCTPLPVLAHVSDISASRHPHAVPPQSSAGPAPRCVAPAVAPVQLPLHKPGCSWSWETWRFPEVSWNRTPKSSIFYRIFHETIQFNCGKMMKTNCRSIVKWGKHDELSRTWTETKMWTTYVFFGWIWSHWRLNIGKNGSFWNWSCSPIVLWSLWWQRVSWGLKIAGDLRRPKKDQGTLWHSQCLGNVGKTMS